MQQNSKLSPALVLFLVLPALGLLVGLGIIIADSATPAGDNEDLQIGLGTTTLNYPASEIELPVLDGETIKLSDYRGRTVFLNFWATWCGPCIAELPELQTFAEQQNALENGAVVLAVNSFDSAGGIQDFLRDNHIDLSDVPILMDTESVAFRQYGVAGMPTTYVIDPDGMVRQMKIGSFTSVEELYSFLPDGES